MELDYITDLPTVGIPTDIILFYLNLAIAIVTNLGALFIVCSMIEWLHRIHSIESFGLRPFIYGVILAKTAVWFWSLTGIVQVLVFHIGLPLVSLPARLLFMFAVVVHSFIILRYRKTYQER